MTAMADILDLVQAALTVAPDTTAAGAAVYSPGDWPLTLDTYPVLLLSVIRERKVALSKNGAPLYMTSTYLRVSGRVSAPPAASDGGAAVAEAALWALGREVEIAVVGYPPLWEVIEQCASIESALAFDSSGAQHIAQVDYTFEFQYPQDAYDFWQPSPAPLTQADITFPNFPTPSGQDVGETIILPGP